MTEIRIFCRPVNKIFYERYSTTLYCRQKFVFRQSLSLSTVLIHLLWGPVHKICQLGIAK